VDGALIFASGGPDGVELWRSDGTETGTFRLKDINPGPGGSAPADFVELAGRVYFSADDGAAGRELWSTDGTPAGTTRVQDIYPGPVGSSPTWLTRSADTLYFSATGRDVGRELWKYTPGPPPATVVGRYVFYNGSSFDGITPGADPADDRAIASDKAALLPGQAPSFANVTTYDKGLNGVMIDVADLPEGPALSAVDFTFAGPNAGGLTSVTVRRGAGVNGSDRVTLIFLEYDRPLAAPGPKAVGNGWLTVTMKANAHTGLSAPDVFSFGNLIGDATGDLRVNALDVAAVKRDLNTPTTVTTRTDINRDGRVNALDVALVKRNLGHALAVPLPVAIPLAAPVAEPPPRRVAEDVLL
jgi:ELWxxDGT repeat protein